ncbi:MAG: DUF1697 domain-containing protein [bacterium]|nr:DUF1697 domain-containing protein [bacterium]
MQQYVALLRGINISGKNKVPMAELKSGFMEAGFTDVSTYLNSGNVIFSSVMDNLADITEKVGSMIRERFDLSIPVYIISTKALKEILDHAPDWWGDESKEIYDNLIFIMAPATYEEVYNEIGEPKRELEQIENYRDTIFWSFSRKDYAKTNWWSKTASADIGSRLTIRTANTVRKLMQLCEK